MRPIDLLHYVTVLQCTTNEERHVLVTVLVTNQAPSTRTEPHNPERTSVRDTLNRHHSALTGQPFVG